MIVQEDIPYTKEEVKAMVKTIHYLREQLKQLGWHPASELPKLKDGEDDVDFIVIIYDEYGMLPFHATYCKYTGWSHDNVKWWCYPPKEE